MKNIDSYRRRLVEKRSAPRRLGSHLVCSYHVNWIRSGCGRERGTGLWFEFTSSFTKQFVGSCLLWMWVMWRVTWPGQEVLSWSNNTTRHIFITQSVKAGASLSIDEAAGDQKRWWNTTERRVNGFWCSRNSEDNRPPLFCLFCFFYYKLTTLENETTNCFSFCSCPLRASVQTLKHFSTKC